MCASSGYPDMQVVFTGDVGETPDVLATDLAVHRLYVAAENGPLAVFDFTGGTVRQLLQADAGPNAQHQGRNYKSRNATAHMELFSARFHDRQGEDLVDASTVHVDYFELEPDRRQAISRAWNPPELGHYQSAERLDSPVCLGPRFG